jgi:hypothetical protein
MHIKQITPKQIESIKQALTSWTDKDIAEFVFLKGRLPSHSDKKIIHTNE